jgi:hypothetical protein
MAGRKSLPSDRRASSRASQHGSAAPASSVGISSAQFEQIGAAYRAQWNLPLLAALSDGTVVLGSPPSPEGAGEKIGRGHAIAEALRWGEPTISEYPGRRLVWAVPLMHNAAGW